MALNIAAWCWRVSREPIYTWCHFRSVEFFVTIRYFAPDSLIHPRKRQQQSEQWSMACVRVLTEPDKLCCLSIFFLSTFPFSYTASVRVLWNRPKRNRPTNKIEQLLVDFFESFQLKMLLRCFSLIEMASSLPERREEAAGRGGRALIVCYSNGVPLYISAYI